MNPGKRLGQKWRWFSLLEDRTLLGIAFVAPAVVLLFAFLAYPLVLGIWLGFTNTVIGQKGDFIGLANYISLLQDQLFWKVTYFTFLYTIAAVLFKLILGFALAIVLNREFRAKGFVRAIVLLPWIIPTVLSAICFWWLFDTTFSGITWILMKVGLIAHKIDYLGDPTNARICIIVANIWRGIPFFTIGLLAGLQTINPTLYEAASIDGAGGWHRFRHITLPLVIPLLTVVTTFSTIWTFADFQLIWVITKGGPANATHVYGTLSFQRAIVGGQFGEGAAISVFILPVLIVCVLVTYKYLRREE
ncbi:MAG: sugar ABC transporter permease [Deltaproteobacteria bacterium]|nr:sugar ABC transporter permease [Deltaproteobacteria bacterium]